MMKVVEGVAGCIILIIALWLGLEGHFERATFLLVITMYQNKLFKKEG